MKHPKLNELISFLEKADKHFGLLNQDSNMLNELKLLIKDLGNRGNKLPEFLDNIDGKIFLTYIGGSDVTKEWYDFIYQNKMDDIDLEHLTNEYLIEKFGSKFGNGSAKQAFIDGYKMALGMNTIIERRPKKKKKSKKMNRMDYLAQKAEREKYL